MCISNERFKCVVSFLRTIERSFLASLRIRRPVVWKTNCKLDISERALITHDKWLVGNKYRNEFNVSSIFLKHILKFLLKVRVPGTLAKEYVLMLITLFFNCKILNNIAIVYVAKKIDTQNQLIVLINVSSK